MDISQLKTFLEVVKTRHFGKAADNLFVTQSAVSARIKLLEELLGIELFVRKRNDIQLTPAGNRLYKHAVSIVKGWERIRNEVALDPDFSGSLALGSMFDLWSTFVGERVSKLQKLLPDTALQIEILSAEALIQRLMTGILDVAFMFDPPHTPDLELREVAKLPLILASTTQNQTVEEALTNNYILVDWGSAFSVIHAETYQDFPAPQLRTNSALVALNLLEDQGGAAYLPEQMVRQHLEKERLFCVEGAPVIDRFSYLVYRTENLSSEKFQNAINILAD